jgi:hypothetical protein
MTDFRLGHRPLGVCVTVAMLSGCGGSQPPVGAPSVSQIAIKRHLLSLGQRRSGFICHGHHHVRVAPCPANLKKSSGVEVQISGPGVVNSALQNCEYICSVSQIDGTHWQVNLGSNCGVNLLDAVGYNATGRYVGYERLKFEG